MTAPTVSDARAAAVSDARPAAGHRVLAESCWQVARPPTAAAPTNSSNPTSSAAGQAGRIRSSTSCSATTACGRVSCGSGIRATGLLSPATRRVATSNAPATPGTPTASPSAVAIFSPASALWTFIADLLRATASRPARFNCFGLHEWAMVYQSPTVRHASLPLRLDTAATDAVIESMPLRCSHFDAYRFFTEPAAVRNAQHLTRESQSRRRATGVRACRDGSVQVGVQAGAVAGIRACPGLPRVGRRRPGARHAGQPHDLRVLGFEPIAVETPGGRRTYVQAQEAITERAAPLRARLLERCLALLDAAAGDKPITAG